MTRSLRRIGKFTAFVALAAVVLTGAARVGVGRYLSSSRGKAMVADRLGSALGMPVEVSDIQVGDDSSSFRFRVMDPADPKAEILTVHSASADVSAADFMTGRVAPSALNLSGASLTLRVSPDGQVLTPLPALPGAGGTVPAVVIANGRICIRQEDRPEFAVSGLNLKLEPVGQTVTLSGTVKDPKWGEWKVSGELHRDTRTGWVELTSADAPLDAELLATIPFVVPELFNEVKSTGRAAVTIRLAIGADRDIQPNVEIRQTRRIFGIPSESVIHLTPTSDRHRPEPLR
jgi:hypothetical protein